MECISIPIHKKGTRRNYRKLTLLNASQKLLTKILLGKLNCTISKKKRVLPNNPFTTDAIIIIRQVVENSTEFDTPDIISLIDI